MTARCIPAEPDFRSRAEQRVWSRLRSQLPDGSVDWGVRIADGRGADYWEDELPADMLDLARRLDDEGRLDALVVDEAQDFLPSWWEPLLAALRDPRAARIAVFTDEQQRIFDREGGVDLGLVPLELDENLRNTPDRRGVRTAGVPGAEAARGSRAAGALRRRHRRHGHRVADPATLRAVGGDQVADRVVGEG